MKKQYIKPQAETLFFEPQTLMRPSGHDNYMPEAKESSFEEEEKTDSGKTKKNNTIQR